MLKLHCDNPACETEVEVEAADETGIPAGWLSLEEVVEEQDGEGPEKEWVRLAIVCSRPCAAAVARMEAPDGEV